MKTILVRCVLVILGLLLGCGQTGTAEDTSARRPDDAPEAPDLIPETAAPAVAPLDETAPRWPAGTSLSVGEEPLARPRREKRKKDPPVFALTLKWPAATDDVSVISYRVRRGAEIIALLPGTAREHRLTDVDPSGDYFVEAGDAADNWSDPGLAVTHTSSGTSEAATAEAARVAAARRAKILEAARGTVTLGILGTKGTGSGTAADILAGGGTASALDGPLEGIDGAAVGLGTLEGGGLRGGGTPAAADPPPKEKREPRR